MRTRFILLVILAFFCQSLTAQSSKNNLTIYLLGLQEGKTYQLRFENTQGAVFLTKPVEGNKLIIPDFKVREFWLKVYVNEKEISAEFFQLNDHQTSILINPNVAQRFALSEVIIQTEEKAIETKSDRIVYHMQASAFQKGYNSVEVMEKVPFVRVMGDDISIVGKGKVTITINDKKVHFSGTQLLAYLKTIPSERIKKIEVITNPPTKYDSYGNGGVINIQLKPATDEGYALLLSSAFTQRYYANFRNNANLNYHQGKWNFNLNLNYARKKLKQEDYSRFVNADLLLRETRKSEVETKDQFLTTARADYQLNKRTNLGLVYTFTSSQGDAKSKQHTFFPGKDKAFNSVLSDARMQKNLINLYADIKLDTSGSKLSLLGTYVYNEAKEYHEATNFQFANKKGQKNEVYEFTGSLETPLNKNLKIDFGVNLIKATNLVSNRAIFTGNQNTFDYNEFTYDLFFDFYWNISEPFSLSGGLKYEGWDRKIETIELHENFVFPTLNLAYKPNSDNDLTLSYSKRIEKPYLNYLDPYREYTAPNAYFVGNPYLEPFTIDNLEVRYAYKSKLFLTLYSQTYEDLFGTVTKLIEGNQVETKENYSSSQQYGAMISYFYRELDWWDMQVMGHTFYQIPSKVSNQFKSFSGLSTSFYVNNDFYLNPDKTTVLGFSYFHSLPTKAIKGKANSISTFNLNFKTPIVKDLLQLKLSVSDLFNQRYRKGRTYFSNGIIQYYNYNLDGRNFNLSLTFSLGKKKSVKAIDNKNRIDR